MGRGRGDGSGGGGLRLKPDCLRARSNQSDIRRCVEDELSRLVVVFGAMF
jgi:hypothetical protein